MNFFAFTLVLAALIPLWAHLSLLHRSYSHDSNIDFQMAESGESLSRKIHAVLAIEKAIARLRQLCHAGGPHPANLASLQLAARALLVREGALLVSLRNETIRLAQIGPSFYHAPLREPGFSCGIPGRLRWRNFPENIFYLRGIDAGFDVFLPQNNEVHWRYAHSKVRSL